MLCVLKIYAFGSELTPAYQLSFLWTTVSEKFFLVWVRGNIHDSDLEEIIVENGFEESNDDISDGQGEHTAHHDFKSEEELVDEEYESNQEEFF